jgi:hypothetical protein
MLFLKIIPKLYAQLAALVTPERADQPEALPYVLYDTQQYVSGTTTRLTFFAGTNADTTMSNIESAGGIPAGQFFEVHKVFVDVLNRPSVNAAATGLGQLDDLALLFNIGRAALTFTTAAKTLGPIPGTFFCQSGGIEGSISSNIAAPAVVEAGTRQHTGGFPVNGHIVLPPQQRFTWTMDFAAAQTLAGGNTNIRLAMLGVLHRPVR